MATNLAILANRAHDEKSFIEFLYMLMKDREDEANKEKASVSSFYHKGNLPEWENESIEEFIDAAIKWSQMTENDPKYYSIPINPWSRIANMLLAGKSNNL